MKKILCSLLLAAFLPACTSLWPQDAATINRNLSFADMPKIALAVSDIEVVNQYKPSMAEPNVDHLASPTPTAAMQQWIADRLVAKGSTQFKARVIIREAMITDTKLDVMTGWRGWFTNEEANKYYGRIQVSIEIVRPDDVVEAYVSARADSTRTTKEDASLMDKENAWFEITSEAMGGINQELEKQIQINFAPILNPAS
jgi:hypothetical protein